MSEDAGASLRSVFHWTVSALHFFPGALVFTALNELAPPRAWDPFFREFTRNIVRLSGARLSVRRSPGFDPSRTCFLVSNHVNVFDPFVIYASVSQFGRGFELESHFRIPIYGWMMRRFGNVPVPDPPTAAGLRVMMRRARAAFESGTSLITFPEGTRTRTGQVGPFSPALLRVAIELGAPVAPVTLDGSFRHHPVGDRRLHPGPITVHLHDTIETAGLARTDAPALAERVRAIVAGPIGGV
jgi:1-acyl-sn-glycerol-3-phosphate acyltransferase